MHSTPKLLVLAVILALAPAATLQSAQQPDPDPTFQERVTLKKQIVALEEKLEKIRAAAMKDSDMAGLLKVLEAAQQVVEETARGSASLMAARELREERAQTAEKAIEEALAADPDASAVLRRIRKSHERTDELDEAREQVQSALRALRKQMAREPEFSPQAEALAKAEQAYEDTMRTDPKLAAAAEAAKAAAQALEERIRDLPEREALEKAEQALEEAKEASTLRAEFRQKRDAAATQLDIAIKGRLAKHPEAAFHLRKLEEIERQMKQLRVERREVERILDEARERLTNDNPAVARARRAHEEAEQEYRQLKEEILGPERQALEKAERAIDEKIQAKLAADHDAAKLQAQIEELQARLEKMTDELREGKGK